MAKKDRKKPPRPQRPQGLEREPSEPTPAAALPAGPYLQMACFCEKVLREADGVRSFIRQVDRLTTTASGPTAPAKMPTITQTLFLAITIKSGGARGSHEIKILRERPSGMRDTTPVLAMTAFFEGEERGVGLYGPITMTLEEEGLYWFDLYVGENLMTRMPIRVIYLRAATQAG